MSWYPGREAAEVQEESPLPSRGSALAVALGEVRRGIAELQALREWLLPNVDTATLVRGAAASLLLVAGSMYSNLIPAYWRSPVYQFLFLAISTGQILGSAALFLRPSQRLFRLGITSTIILLAFYLFTRFIELPFTPHPNPERLVGSQWLLAQWIQAAFILACLYVLRFGAAEDRAVLILPTIPSGARGLLRLAARGTAILAIGGAAVVHLFVALEHQRLHEVPGVALTPELEVVGLNLHQIAFLMMAVGEALIGLVMATRPPRFLYYLGIPLAFVLVALSVAMGLPLFDPSGGQPLGLTVVILELAFALCLFYLIRDERRQAQPLVEEEPVELETYEEYEPSPAQEPYARGTPARMVAPRSYLSYGQSHLPPASSARPSPVSLLGMIIVMALSGAYLAVLSRPWLVSVPLQQLYLRSGTSAYESVQLAQSITTFGLLGGGVLLAITVLTLISKHWRGAP